MDSSVPSNPMPRPTIQSSQTKGTKRLNNNTKNPSETSLTTNQNFLPKCEMGLKKARKKRLTGLQVRLLESSFNSNRRLDAQRKLQLATELRLPPRQVAIWYQNRRARHKSQTIELDYKTIQIKLDSTLVENERLEREVDLLKQQLHKAHEMLLIASNYPPACPLSSHSASDGVDDGGSSFPGRLDGSWDCLLYNRENYKYKDEKI
ncbi:Homeobox domain [Dillenia turbinata]|uniref:Homeobox-leucine zipper protein n=1 Tax=Dillenia turbinata TaxID=194707 RepID=A0AAN8Z3B7_9MAGN